MTNVATESARCSTRQVRRLPLLWAAAEKRRGWLDQSKLHSRHRLQAPTPVSKHGAGKRRMPGLGAESRLSARERRVRRGVQLTMAADADQKLRIEHRHSLRGSVRGKNLRFASDFGPPAATMSPEIKVGDLVMVVRWPHKHFGRQDALPGTPFVVKTIETRSACTFCGQEFGAAATTGALGNGYHGRLVPIGVPIAWLKKIEPDAEKARDRNSELLNV
jgi:hypothetical protein